MKCMSSRSITAATTSSNELKQGPALCAAGAYHNNKIKRVSQQPATHSACNHCRSRRRRYADCVYATRERERERQQQVRSALLCVLVACNRITFRRAASIHLFIAYVLYAPAELVSECASFSLSRIIFTLHGGYGPYGRLVRKLTLPLEQNATRLFSRAVATPSS
jgi:hypothetical protein